MLVITWIFTLAVLALEWLAIPFLIQTLWNILLFDLTGVEMTLIVAVGVYALLKMTRGTVTVTKG